ncbi:MAG: glycosyltransferase family 2 protein [Lachnospiraceae bacterium]|nr:glycosyltransferase family 2 protein [Lachnospiraceae bacterium]
MKYKKDFLTIIAPCFNEEEGIGRFLDVLTRQMDGSNQDYEIICVDDGSRDRTIDILKKAAEKNIHCRYISFSRNFGKESAMLAGLEHASGDMVIIMDSDLQHPPELIPQMIQKHKEGYDQVIACRDRSGDKKSSIFFAKMYYRIVNHLINVQLQDGAGDYRLLSRRAVEAIISMRETNRFSKGLFSWVGYKQTAIYYKNQQRLEGESKWSFKSLLRYGIDGIISFNTSPLMGCVYLGGTLLTISILYLLYIFINIVFNGIDVPGYFTTIAIIILTSGTQLLSLGIIGEYVGRIYFESKRRPAYLIMDTNIEDE